MPDRARQEPGKQAGHRVIREPAVREAGLMTGMLQQRGEEDRAVEAAPLPVHQHAGRAAQHAAVRKPPRARLHPAPQLVRVAPDLLDDVRGVPPVPRCVPLAVGDRTEAAVEQREPLAGRERAVGSRTRAWRPRRRAGRDPPHRRGPRHDEQHHQHDAPPLHSHLTASPLPPPPAAAHRRGQCSTTPTSPRACDPP